jgi:hypothetical protein
MEDWNEDEDADWGEGEAKEEQLTGAFMYVYMNIYTYV